MKDPKGNPLLKEWLVATTSPKTAARIATECPGDHKRGATIGGGVAASTAYYPDEFARRAVRAMIGEDVPDPHEFMRNLAEPESPEGQALAAGEEPTPLA